MKNSQVLDVLVRSRDRVLYQGIAKSVSSENETGKFDVLPLHSNFISLINAPLKVVEETGRIKMIPVTNGLLRVDANHTEVFVGIGAEQSLSR